MGNIYQGFILIKTNSSSTQTIMKLIVPILYLSSYIFAKPTDILADFNSNLKSINSIVNCNKNGIDGFVKEAENGNWLNAFAQVAGIASDYIESEESLNSNLQDLEKCLQEEQNDKNKNIKEIFQNLGVDNVPYEEIDENLINPILNLFKEPSLQTVSRLSLLTSLNKKSTLNKIDGILSENPIKNLFENEKEDANDDDDSDDYYD